MTAYEMRISDWSADVCSSDLPVTDANNFNFSISATGDVTLGVVSVTGGDQGLINGASFDDFAANVMGAVSTGGDITIGGVDYSGYGAAATIDVSAYEGAATIIGDRKSTRLNSSH